jgi:hypothetical protein
MGIEQQKQRVGECMRQSEERQQKLQREYITERIQSELRSLKEVDSKFLVSDENELGFTTTMKPITPGVTDMSLTEYTFPILLEHFNKNTIIYIEHGFSLGESHAAFLEAVKANDVILLFKNSNHETMKDYTDITLEAPYVLVYNRMNGRFQEVIVIGLKCEFESHDETAEDEAASQETPQLDQAAAIETTDSSGSRTPPTLEEEVAFLIKDKVERSDRRATIDPPSESGNCWQKDTRLVLHKPNPDYKKLQILETQFGKDFREKMKPGYALKMSMYAVDSPEKHKYIKFQQDHSCAINVVKTEDTDQKKGPYIVEGHTHIYPIGPTNESINGDDIHWYRHMLQPTTTTTVTKHSTTTGWSATAGLSSNHFGAFPTISATINRSNTEMVELQDFSVQNVPKGDHPRSMTSWRFFFTRMNNWMKEKKYSFREIKYVLQDLESDLANKQLLLKAESIYEGHANDENTTHWMIEFSATFRFMWLSGFCSRVLRKRDCQWKMQCPISMNLKCVNTPKDNST